MRLKVILKVIKKTRFLHLFRRYTFFEKPQGGIKSTSPPRSRFRVKPEIMVYYHYESMIKRRTVQNPGNAIVSVRKLSVRNITKYYITDKRFLTDTISCS